MANPENRRLLELIEKLRKDKRPFWRYIARLLDRPRRKRIEVNVSKINKYAKEGCSVVVPGKVLGDGRINMPVIVAAFAFSKRAIKEIEENGGKVVKLEEFYEENKNKKNYKDFIIIV